MFNLRIDKRSKNPQVNNEILQDSELKVGQRVEAIGYPNYSKLSIGSIGTICNINDKISIGVVWNELTTGHSCGGKCKAATGWYIQKNKPYHGKHIDYHTPHSKYCP